MVMNYDESISYSNKNTMSVKKRSQAGILIYEVYCFTKMLTLKNIVSWSSFLHHEEMKKEN